MARRLYDEHGNEVRVRRRGGCLKWLGIGLILFVAIGFIGSMGQDDSTTLTPPTTSVSSTKKNENNAPVNMPEPADNVPTEYQNALKKGEFYAKTMSMSKQGVYDQLTSEYGEAFPEDAAQYATDNLDIDWNENALKKAQSYYENMSMSKDGVYNQLVSEYGEQFTSDQAQYAVDNLN